MKILGKEDLKGIDSTKETLKKWDSFLREGVINLGFKQRVVDEMYPYSKGIPLKNGEYLPVGDTGRVFFKLSWADKLAGVLSCLNSSSIKNETNKDIHQVIEEVMSYIWFHYKDFTKICFPDITEEQLNSLYNSKEEKDSILYTLWTTFIENSRIESLKRGSYTTLDMSTDLPIPHIYTSSDKTRVYAKQYKKITLSNSELIWIYNGLSQKYDGEFPISAFISAFRQVGLSSAVDKLAKFGEVYTQDYMVVSLNPIDKLMCSTKQAFSSCISLAKQNETQGTNSVHAFGLPALFPSDSIFLVFMTPGKHKNMYWEKGEWDKDPADRDKDKAYKYLKMTCRSLTYKGVPVDQVKERIKTLRVNSSEQAKEQLDSLKIEQERLFIGRQYAAGGEDLIWPQLAEILLGELGIATGQSFSKEYSDLAANNSSLYMSILSTISTNRYDTSLLYRYGNFVGDRGVELDRFGFRRGIYYDNLCWTWSKEYLNWRNSRVSTVETPFLQDGKIGHPINSTDKHLISVGSGRYGSCGVSDSNMKSGLDAFKLLTGKQDFTYFNCAIKICSHCGKTLLGEESKYKTAKGKSLCSECIEELQMKVCPSCNMIYDSSEAHLHEIYNIRELTNPKNYQDLPPKLVCRLNLERTALYPNRSLIDLGLVDPSSPKYICLHCGDIYDLPLYHVTEYLTRTMFHGIMIRVSLCNTCLKKGVVCDRCKKVVFIDSIDDACLLLTNRRVICSDCVADIRATKELKNKYVEVLKTLTELDVDPTHIENITDDDLTAKIAKQVLESGRKIGNVNTMIKDLQKQIKSYRARHKGMLPILKTSKSKETVSQCTQ